MKTAIITFVIIMVILQLVFIYRVATRNAVEPDSDRALSGSDIYIIEPKFNLKWIFGSLTAIIALAFIKPQLAYFLFCCWLVWNAMHIELVHRYKKGKNVQSLGLSVAKMFLRNIFIALMLHYIVFDILIHISAIRIVIFYIYTTLEMIF
ncbi:hypothetical protein, partial [Stenoxybacter acetivorans]|uniref:hypothetical protein n=1 Tax=Stenoxybacter acetivorans TaxID=422441 RepID=UPI00056CA705